MSLKFTTRALTLPALMLGGLALTACSAQGYGQGSQYAGANCVPPAQSCGGRYSGGQYGGSHYGAASYGGNQYSGGSTRYGTSYESAYGTSYQSAGYQTTAYGQQYYAQPSYQTVQAPYYQQSYTAPSQAVDVQLYSPTTSYAAPANCPAGTTAQSDGTCLQGSSYTSSSYVSSSYSMPSASSYSTSSMSANCPAGTTAQSDGTCLQGGSSSSYAASSTSSYSPSYGSSSGTVAPPISEYNWGSRNTTWGEADYISPGSRTVDAVNSYPSAGSTVSATSNYSYQPVRK